MVLLRDTAVWRDALLMPAVIADVAVGLDGADALAERLRSARRVVATGNGAAFYAASVLGSAALEHPGPNDVLAVPAGLLTSGHVRLGADDLLLVVSSSGELRDVITFLGAATEPVSWALITSTADSTLGRSAALKVVVPVRSQTAVTHSQAYVGNVVALLALWQRVLDSDLGLDLGDLARLCADAVDAAPAWADAAAETVGGAVAGIAFGSGGAWPAAMETALLMKEVAGIPVEGMETREGATSGMYALRSGHVVLSHPCADAADAADTAEAESVCAATGATVVRLPGAEGRPALSAPVLTFPAALALATTLGLRAGLDVDHPSWTAAYYATARTS